MDRQTAPHGSWRSPITANLIATGSIGLDHIALDGEDTYWVESRPTEGGRCVIVRRTPDGQRQDCTPAPFNVRTRVHEYGGRCYLVDQGTLTFANFADQRLYRQTPGAVPEPITPAVDQRYADGVLDRRRARQIWVREDHTQSGTPINTLVSLSLTGPDAGSVLVSGHDFYAFPRLSPDGNQLAWIAWNQPNMPWDGTELWVADLGPDGQLSHRERIAGGPTESIFQPAWSPDGTLYFVSDRSGWWNLYRWRQGQAEALAPRQAEFGRPLWHLGASTYGFASERQLIASYTQEGVWHVASLDTTSGQLEPIAIPDADVRSLQIAAGRAVYVGGSPTEALAIAHLDLASGRREVLSRSSTITVDSNYLSIPEALTFPTSEGQTGHAFVYLPRNPAYAAPPGERPPLLVICHGGPTGATSATLRLEVQFWASRGFAVVDVNYGGSTGYGRAYRERLNDRWGIVDIDDCVNAARFLVARGDVDGQRLAIRGGSAGGYTTLAALTFRDVFRAGASYYGVSDLEALALETHKFEARYLDGLIGPYPQRQDLYRQRSPIHAVDRLACPLILLQGLEDKVVPPNQAETMFTALRAKGLPVAYVAFAGEQHGFRRAENIQRALEAELYFYARVFGFPVDETIAPVPIENLPA